MMRHFCKTFCLAGIVLLYCATITQAQPKEEPQTPKPAPQSTYQNMICRGAPGAFSIGLISKGSTDYPSGNMVYVLLRLKNRSSTAPHGDYSKIDRGTCSWDDRIINDTVIREEDRGMRYIAVPGYISQQYKIRRALSNSNGLLSFRVRLRRNYDVPPTWWYEARSFIILPPLISAPPLK
jgi:hypothetical protein